MKDLEITQKCRIFRQLDSDLLLLDWPHPQYQPDHLHECPIPPYYKEIADISTYVIFDQAHMPLLGKDYFEHAQLYLENDHVLADTNWERCLMPARAIRARHVKRVIAQRNALLEQSDPDAIKVLRLQMEMEKAKSWTDIEWYGQALKNLDRRVQVEGEPDKPVIREKLKQKIAQLQEQQP